MALSARATANTIYLFLFLFSLALPLSAAQVTIPFIQYPSCVQPLAATLPHDCNYGYANNAQATQENNCLCADTSWLTTFALSVYTTCDCDDLQRTAQALQDNCALTSAAVALTAQQFVEAGSSSCGSGSGSDGGPGSSSSSVAAQTGTASTPSTFRTSTVTSSTSSSSSTTSSTTTSDPSTGLQKTGNQIALAIGIVGIIVGVIVTAYKKEIKRFLNAVFHR